MFFLDAFDLSASSGIKLSLLKKQCTMDLTVDLPDSLVLCDLYMNQLPL